MHITSCKPISLFYTFVSYPGPLQYEIAHGAHSLSKQPADPSNPILPIPGFIPAELTLNLTGKHGNSHRVDGAIYQNSKLTDDHKSNIADMGLAEICIEAKTIDDPFYVSKTGHFGVKNGTDHMENMGQICGYASDMMYMGHRSHCFMIGIFAKNARLLHFSRSMVNVTRSFSLVDEPDVLPCFLRVFNAADAAERGWDTSMSLCSEIECTQTIHDVLTASKESGADPALARFAELFKKPL
jgi:hypothetical protein